MATEWLVYIVLDKPRLQSVILSQNKQLTN